jgi:pimeloyl-ACP methyl ester carboxylesterase
MPLSMTPVHPEGPRYRAPLVFLPGLWAGPGAWRRAASLLAHRGWEGWLVDLAGRGGVAQRAAALAGAVAELERPAVLIGTDAGGIVALETARLVPAAALVWVAPVLPGGRTIRRAVSPWQVLLGLTTGRAVGRPAGWAGEEGLAWARDHEDARLVVDVVRGRHPARGAGVPTALVDAPFAPEAPEGGLAASLGADVIPVAEGGRTALATGAWQANAGTVHRWLVQRLGEPVLERYEEAMADRDGE